MANLHHKLLLADDDDDDCIFFKDVIKEISPYSTLVTVNDGVQLLNLLTARTHEMPDVLFLDLNMPLKNGLECLIEIKSSDDLRYLPVIILSTSLDIEMMNVLYEKGALHYIRKPGHFDKLKKVVHLALTIISQNHFTQPTRDKFMLQP